MRSDASYGNIGSQSSSIYAGGGPAGIANELWNQGFSTKTITVS